MEHIKLYAVVAVLLLLVSCLPVSAQKSEEMLNSYNFKRGMELLYGETPDESGAYDSFSKEVVEHPNNGYAWYELGLIYSHNQQEGNALECFNKAVTLMKKDKEWLPYAYRLRAETYLKLGNESEALKDWKAGLKIDPENENILYDRAEYYFDKKQYDVAEADYDAMIAARPGNTLGYKGKGRNADARGDYQKAVDLFTYGLTLDPNDGAGYSNRGEAYIHQKKWSEAADDIIKAIGHDNDYAFVLVDSFKNEGKDILLAKLRIQQAKDRNNGLWTYLQGIVQEHTGDYELAIKSYNASYDINASDVVLEHIATCYSDMGEFNKALEYIDRAIAMDSTDNSYLMEKADFRYYSGDTNGAIAIVTKYIEKLPEFFYGYYRRGFYKDNAKDYDGAIEDYTTCIVQNPNYAYAYLGRADCNKAKGKTDEAMTDYRKVVEIDTAYVEGACAYYALLELGEKDKAKAFMDSMLVHVNTNGIYYDASCLYCRMGEYDKAMDFLKQAFEKGYREFAHIDNDDDLDPLKNRDDFKALINEYKVKVKGQSDEDTKDSGKGAHIASVQRISEIPFTRETDGLCKVRCNINGLPLNFWLDTGASDVSLSMVEATFMLKNGYLTKDDIVGSSRYLDANGNVSEGTVVNLRKVSFGDSELTNVKAGVVGNLRAPLLLGQSVLARLGSIEIDNAKSVIRIKYYK